MEEFGDRLHIEIRHIDIQKNDIGFVFERQLIGLAPVGRLYDTGDISLPFQEHPQTLPKESLSLENEQPDGSRLNSMIDSIRFAFHGSGLTGARPFFFRLCRVPA